MPAVPPLLRARSVGDLRVSGEKIRVFGVSLDEVGYEQRVRYDREATRAQVVEGTLHEPGTEPLSFEPRLGIDGDENPRPRLDPLNDLGDEHAVEVEFIPPLLGVVDNAHIGRPRHLDRLATRNHPRSPARDDAGCEGRACALIVVSFASSLPR